MLYIHTRQHTPTFMDRDKTSKRAHILLYYMPTIYLYIITTRYVMCTGILRMEKNTTIIYIIIKTIIAIIIILVHRCTSRVIVQYYNIVCSYTRVCIISFNISPSVLCFICTRKTSVRANVQCRHTHAHTRKYVLYSAIHNNNNNNMTACNMLIRTVYT